HKYHSHFLLLSSRRRLCPASEQWLYPLAIQGDRRRCIPASRRVDTFIGAQEKCHENPAKSARHRPGQLVRATAGALALLLAACGGGSPAPPAAPPTATSTAATVATATATPAENPGGVVYVGSDDRAVYALHTGSGQVVWRITLGGKVLSVVVAG